MATDSVLEGGGIRLDVDRAEVTVRGREVKLTRKEFDLLACLMENAGRALPREVLIDRVWGTDYFGDTRTLDVHMKRLRSKLEEDPHDPVLLVTVRGLGYKFAT
jgi:two-component system response regulator RegX3